MKSKTFTFCSIALLALRMASSVRAQSLHSPINPTALTTQFTEAITLQSPSLQTKQIRLWIPIPSDSPQQHISQVSIHAPVPYRITQEKLYHNRMAYLVFDQPNQKPISIEVSWVVTRHSNPQYPAQWLSALVAAQLLRPDRLVPVGGSYAALALQQTASASTPYDKAKDIFDYVTQHFEYDYTDTSPEYGQGDVAFVCSYKKGNCSDIHSVLVTLLRSLGIPAYIAFGFPLTGIPAPNPLPTEGMIGGYHCWVWANVPHKGWIPMDAADAIRWNDHGYPQMANKLFGALYLPRTAVDMSCGRDIVLSPPQKAGPLNYFIYPYAEADGKALPVHWQLQFKVLSSLVPAR
ncbi:transglutaminase-like enzyme, predicted cysteine protease [Chthonomonas calidirosea]|uniref:transglutaminase-like domain-containing protein n=1 Tax=Chthonomonas calidirosea TaxID=454171 RepID=UPI0006DD4E46|nr:transglutaminase domain-containing protein [Chthonomonas calidirosea]CEK14648.1 transglutaminase-like enzyme, predicted cysteine protease [Chthonomonas calidirosea]